MPTDKISADVHFVIDFETLGLRASSIITEFAITVVINKEVVETAEMVLDTTHQIESRTIDASTMEWRQEHGMSFIQASQISLYEMIEFLNTCIAFYAERYTTLMLWSWRSFDYSLITDLEVTLNTKIAIPYNRRYDIPSVASVLGVQSRTKNTHSAKQDTINEAQTLIKCLDKMDKLGLRIIPL